MSKINGLGNLAGIFAKHRMAHTCNLQYVSGPSSTLFFSRAGGLDVEGTSQQERCEELVKRLAWPFSQKCVFLVYIIRLFRLAKKGAAKLSGCLSLDLHTNCPYKTHEAYSFPSL